MGFSLSKESAAAHGKELGKELGQKHIEGFKELGQKHKEGFKEVINESTIKLSHDTFGEKHQNGLTNIGIGIGLGAGLGITMLGLAMLGSTRMIGEQIISKPAIFSIV